MLDTPSPFPPATRAVLPAPTWKKRYTICTMVTRPAEYAGMVKSFEERGFGDDCEFLYADNSKSNAMDAFLAYRTFLNAAQGEYVIMCHQDVLLLEDGREKLDRTLADLQARDPTWAICGNSGGGAPGVHAARITDPHGVDQSVGDLPQRVAALDENFIVVKAAARLSLSRDLKGFHFYATDLCLVADILGWTSYVIDFHLFHKSDGKADPSFATIRRDLMGKYRRAFRSRWFRNPSTIMFVGGAGLGSWLAQSSFGVKLVHSVGARMPALARMLFKSAT